MKALLFGVFAWLFVACVYTQDGFLSIIQEGKYDAECDVTYYDYDLLDPEVNNSTGVIKTDVTKNFTIPEDAEEGDFSCYNVTNGGHSFLCNIGYEFKDVKSGKCVFLTDGGSSKKCDESRYCNGTKKF